MEHLELSAFLVIAWYTYRNIGMLKFSVLVRTIVAEGTIYFLAMVAIQVYCQLSLRLMKVQSPSFFRSLPHSAIVNHGYPRVSGNNVRYCEFAIYLNDNGTWVDCSHLAQ